MHRRCCPSGFTAASSDARRASRHWSVFSTTSLNISASGSAAASTSRNIGLKRILMDNSTHADLLKRYINVADERLGAVALSTSDDFFAAKERMLKPTEPEWRAGVYDENGKWMDGWESRRRRDDGHDYCIVKLA